MKMFKAKIVEYRDISLDDLSFGTKQVRVSDTGAEIDELATSIQTVGLLQPIMVVPAEAKGKYEIILGQRRYLACRKLKLHSITAAILSEKVDEITAKIISLTENMMRRNLTTKDLMDVCHELYKKYGSMIEVARASGLPYDDVRKYVKYDRLPDKLKELYDEKKVDLKTLLDASDAVGTREEDQTKAAELALAMAKMGGDQKKRTASIVARNPDQAIEKAIEDAKKQKVEKISFVFLETEYRALSDYAKETGQAIADAASELVLEGLKKEGYLEDDED
jgi:ParB family chromosome partitioning protein